MEINLELEKFYLTRAGNTVWCVRERVPGEFTCIVTEVVVPGHEILLNTHQAYLPDGKWKRYPGGIHDIVSEKP